MGNCGIKGFYQVEVEELAAKNVLGGTGHAGVAGAPVREALEAKGPVKVVGKIKPTGKPLIAPLSGKPCVYYEVRISQFWGYYSSDDNPFGGEAWNDLAYEVKRSDFSLEDDDGRRLMVAADRCEFFCEKEMLGSDRRPGLEAFLKSKGLSMHKTLLNRLNTNEWPFPKKKIPKTLCCHERRLEAGKTVACLGVVVPDARPWAAPELRPVPKAPKKERVLFTKKTLKAVEAEKGQPTTLSWACLAGGRLYVDARYSKECQRKAAMERKAAAEVAGAAEARAAEAACLGG